MINIKALGRVWEVQSDGGSWSIRSAEGDVVADDIPYGAVAEHIVELHNNDLLNVED